MLKRISILIVVCLIINSLIITPNIFSSENISYSVSIDDLGISENVLESTNFPSSLSHSNLSEHLVKTLFYAIPPSAQVTSITANAESYDIVPKTGIYDIFPTESFYNLKESNLPCLYFEQGKFRKWNFVKVYYVPLVVQNNVVKVFKKVNFTIEYDESNSNTHGLSDSTFDSIASELFVNYTEAQTWYKKPLSVSAVERCDFLIILSNNLLDQAVSEFVKYKEEVDDLKVKTVTVSDITSRSKGSTLEIKIRNYIKEHYLEWGIKYVMLVGDTRTLPMCYMYPEPNETRDEDAKSRYIGRTPTDFFYSELDSNWDYDGDGLPGEYGEDTDYIVDFYPDVFVGRVPFSDSDDVRHVLDNAIKYEQSDEGFRKSALLVGAMLYYAEEGTVRQDGALALNFARENYLEPVKFAVTSMYETDGTKSSVFKSELPLTNENFSTALRSGKYGLILLNAHGSPQYIARKYWVDSNGNGEVDSGEIKWIDLITPTDLNGYKLSPSIFYSASCETAWPERNSFAKATLSRGAAAYIGASRISYGGGTIDPILEGFVKHFTLDNFGLGDSLGISLFEAPYFRKEDFVNLYDYNLYGDPSLRVNGIYPAGVNILTDNRNLSLFLGKSQNIVLNLFIPKANDFSLGYSVDVEGIKCEFSKENVNTSQGVSLKVTCAKDSPIGDFTINVYAKDSDGRIYGFPIHLKILESKFNPADLNQDGNINEDDFKILKSSFGFETGDLDFNPQTDLNGDGVVDGIDLILFALNFNG